MTDVQPLSAGVDRQMTLLRMAARVDPHLRQAVADVEEHAARQAETIRELKAALEEAREAINWRDNEIRLGIRDELGEAAIRALGERVGYGVLMSTASRLWYEAVGGGAFAVGSPIYFTKRVDERIAAALTSTEARG